MYVYKHAGEKNTQIWMKSGEMMCQICMCYIQIFNI